MDYLKSLDSHISILNDKDINKAYKKYSYGTGSSKEEKIFDIIYFAKNYSEIIEWLPGLKNIKVDQKLKTPGGEPFWAFVSSIFKREIKQYDNERKKMVGEILNMKLGHKFKFQYLSGRMFDKQIEKSKKRNHNPPDYTKSKFRDWLKKNEEFSRIHTNWVYSGFRSEYKPSVDRIDPSDGYKLSNIRTITWGENDALNVISNRINPFKNNDGFWDNTEPVSELSYKKVLKSRLKVIIYTNWINKLGIL